MRGCRAGSLCRDAMAGDKRSGGGMGHLPTLQGGGGGTKLGGISNPPVVVIIVMAAPAAGPNYTPCLLTQRGHSNSRSKMVVCIEDSRRKNPC